MSQKENTNPNSRPRTSQTVRILRSATVAVVMLAIGIAMGFC